MRFLRVFFISIGDFLEVDMSDKRQLVKKLLISALVIGIIILLAYLLMRHFGLTGLDREEIQAFIESTGTVAPLIYILVSFLQVTFVPIPGAITIIAGNYVFGAVRAFIYSYIGMFIGSMLAYYLGKWIGRPFANWLAGDKEKVDEWMAKLHGREKVLLFYMFFLPVFPDDLLCSIAGILPISTLTFVVMQLITRATSVFFTLIFMSGAVQGWAYVCWIVAAVLTLPLFIYCYKHADKVTKFFSDLGKKIMRKKQL